MEQEETVISLNNVSKTFGSNNVSKTKGRNAPPNRTFLEFTRQLFKRKEKVLIHALDNVSLNVSKGEILGVIGRNGSGKSTLLSIILGSIKPDDGAEVTTRGSVMRLSLGLGIDKNLSARDNIYINGTILGLSFKKIGQIFDDIIDFADLQEYIDVPVKHYSRGMIQRLVFAIAMHADSDIFLLDEFFGGVGDQDFRKKSDQAFINKINEGKTIVIVSHSSNIILKYLSLIHI